jgi:hypothetical protein
MSAAKEVVMRRKLLLACIFLGQAILYLGLAPHAFGATPLPSTTYKTDATWTAAGSPYILNGNVTVDVGATLTIEPGVVVKLNGSYRSINVSGKIIAIGRPDNGILITSAQDDAPAAGGDTNGDGTATTPAPGQWYNIWLRAGGSLFEHVEIRYGALGSGHTWGYGAVNVSGGTSYFNKVYIHDNQYSGIRVNPYGTPNATAEITESLISKNGTGLAALNGRLVVTGSHIVENKDDGLFFNLGSTYPGQASSVINNEIAKNGKWGVNIWNENTLPSGSFPEGHRNNILGNNTASSTNKPRQFSLLNGSRPDVSWENNYWGVEQAGPVKAIYCPAAPAGKNVIHLVYGDDPSLTDTNVPPGPITYKTYLKSTPDGRYIEAYCGSDDVDGYPFSASPFRVPIFGFTPLSPAREQEVARVGYRPFLFFDEAEAFQPIILDWFFSEDDPIFDGYQPYHWACAGDNCWRAGSTADLYGADHVDVGQVGGSPPGAWQSPRTMSGGACEGSDFLDCMSEPYAGMYYNRTVVDAAVSGEGVRSYWDYWWFYRYNDYTASPVGGDHEGDWEGMTVVTGPENPDGTASSTVLWVGYAQHQYTYRYSADVLTFTGLHPHGYPADGSHATYPHICQSNYLTACTNYANPWFDEDDHGGEEPGTLNSSCSACVLRFPETDAAINDPTVSPAEGKAGWNALDVKYGGSDTPGTQDRYLAPWSAEPGPDFPHSAVAMSVGPARASATTIDEADCGSWFGPGISALVCDEGQMQRALDYNTFGRARGSLTLRVPAGSKVGSTVGLVQVLGRPLRNGDKVEFVGKIPSRAEIRLRVLTGKNRVAVARFTRVALKGGTLRLSVRRLGRRALVRLVRPNGRVVIAKSLTVRAR